MKGAIIGDIVGSRFEFNNTKNKDFKLLTSDCNFTDDTICTIAVADALAKNYPFQTSLLNWCKRYPSPMGGYGGSFKKWIFSTNPQPYWSFGNGSAMRVSPCGWLPELSDALTCAYKSAECSHDHPEGLKGAQFIAHCIWLLRNGFSKKEVVSLGVLYSYDVRQSVQEIRATNKFNETCQITIPQSVACFIESDGFEDAIRNAVSIGGDSDTIAAITGSLAEVHYGIPAGLWEQASKFLPDEFINVISSFEKYTD